MSGAYIYTGILVMAGVTYLIRALPMLFFNRPIRSPFVQSLLYYVPYAVLTAMTLPAVFLGGIPLAASLAGFLCAVWCAWKGYSLLTVAAAAAFCAWAVSLVCAWI